MINLFLGNVGSGKTLNAVRLMYNSQHNIKTFSNIKTKKIKNNITIDASMIIKKELLKTIRQKDGTEKPVYEYKLNMEYWRKLSEQPLNVVLDEAHSILNSRRAMSKINILVTDWIALIRRILGNREGQYGQLTLISQLDRRIDVITRDMATNISYHTMHYIKQCKKCLFKWREHSNLPEPVEQCPKCGNYYIDKINFFLHVLKFANIDKFQSWKDYGIKTYYNQYIVKHVEKYFKYYSTLQWDNLFSEYY